MNDDLYSSQSRNRQTSAASKFMIYSQPLPLKKQSALWWQWIIPFLQFSVQLSMISHSQASDFSSQISTSLSLRYIFRQELDQALFCGGRLQSYKFIRIWCERIEATYLLNMYCSFGALNTGGWRRGCTWGGEGVIARVVRIRCR